VADKAAMKRKTLILLTVLVACGMAVSCLTRLLIAVLSSRMTVNDTFVLREWMELVRQYPEMQDLPSRAEAARAWAKTVADNSRTDASALGLTPTQAASIRGFVTSGLNSGAAKIRDRLPQRDGKPSECLRLNPYFFDRDALERLAINHALAELIDQCWQIGYEAGRSLSNER
jgi:hypothetical protein